MRTIDATMNTALAARTRRPAIALTIEDHIIHLSPYQTPGLADSWSDCCIANDGSIVRVNLTRNNLAAFAQNFQFSRITDPSIAGQWSTATTFSGGSANMFQDGGCCVSNNAGTLRAFAQQGTGSNNVLVWTSTNNGVSWTGPVAVATPPGGALMKGVASAGNNDVFFFYDVFGGDAMGFSKFTGSWSAFSTWTLPNTNAGQGLAVYWTGSLYNIVYSDGFTLYTATYNGTTWNQGQNIFSTTTNSVGHVSPRLSFFDGLYHLSCSEYDTGTNTGATYQFIRVRESADFIHWSDGWIVPEISTVYSGNYFYLPAPQTGSSGARYYLALPSTVLSTQAFSTGHSNQYLDVSASVLSYKRVEKINKTAEFVVLIDNKSGVYNRLVNLTGSTSYQPIGPGATMKLSEGYKVSGTPDTILTGAYRIMKVAMLRTPTENQIQIIGLDLTERLDRKIRWQNTIIGQTLQYCLLEVATRAGIFNINVTGGTQLSQQIFTFVMQANVNYRHALDALCTTYGVDYFIDQTETLQVREIQASDPSIWSYQNEIEQVAFGQDFNRANHIVANGKPPGGGYQNLTSSEVYDNQANAAMRVERLMHHTDMKIFNTTQTGIAVGLILYAEQRAQADTRLVVPLNPALQLVDVVTVTDSAAPVGTGQSTVGRIIEHQAIYDAQKAEYESHLSLQGH